MTITFTITADQAKAFARAVTEIQTGPAPRYGGTTDPQAFAWGILQELIVRGEALLGRDDDVSLVDRFKAATPEVKAQVIALLSP
jgi:hypothetical protein